MRSPIKSLWLLFILRQCTNPAQANSIVNKETRTLSHFSESAKSESYKNVIFSEKIPQIRPTAAPATWPATEPRGLPAAPSAGNHSNYVRTASDSTSLAGDSKQPDPTSFFPDLFQANDEGNERTAGQIGIDSVKDGATFSNKFSAEVEVIANKIQIPNESYHEAPQKFVVDDCVETNPKFGSLLYDDLNDKDMEHSSKEKYPEAKRIEISNDGVLHNFKFVHYKGDPFAQRTADYQKYTLVHKLLNSDVAVTKSIIERDISMERLTRKQDSSKNKPKFETNIETTTNFIYNPEILDSSDEIDEADEVNVIYSEYGKFNKSTPDGVTGGTIYASYTESVWQETEKDKPRIRFSELPQRETYLTPSLKLEDGPFPFQFMSGFFTLIYPYDVPVGQTYDLKLHIARRMTLSYRQSARLEWRFLALALLFAACALLVPAYLACRAALALCRRGAGAGAGGDSDRTSDEHATLQCGERLQLAQLLVVMIVCGHVWMFLLVLTHSVCVVGMTLSNESAAAAVKASGRALRCGCADLSTWITAAARDLRHALALPADIVLAHYKEDLRNVEQLLGEPIQKAIASESGVDLVLDSINDITRESSDIARKISSLRDVCVKGSQGALAASERLRDLSRQMDSLKKQCAGRDAPLCDTINPGALEINVKFDLVLHEQQLLQLRALGAENLTRAANAAHQHLRRLPASIAAQTLTAREEIARKLESRRDAVHRSSKVLGDMVRHLSAALKTGARRAQAVLTRLKEYDSGRWTAMLGCAVASSFVVTLTISGLLCGCGNAGTHAKRTLHVSICWMCIVSLALWTTVIAAFLVAGHAEVYICRALWDSPEYTALTSLLDRPSGSEARGEAKGMIDELFRDLENVTVDVPIRDVIRECEQDRPAYSVFRLERVLDINQQTAYFEWTELEEGLTKLSAAVDVGTLKEMSLDLSQTLQDMLKVSHVNMAHYRLQYNGPLVGKDLASLAEQLENVATQLSDLSTSSRIETLASRTRRLLVSKIGPLEQLRSELVYKLTELELQLVPFHRQLNTSLSHIRTMQYYVDNQGDLIAQKKVSVYTGRLVSHTAGWRTHALGTATARAARCRPLYSLFSAARALTCSHYVASLHGFWLCALCCAALWCYAVPCSLQLCGYFIRRGVGGSVLLANSNSSQHELSTICDSGNWNTPGLPPPPNDNW